MTASDTVFAGSIPAIYDRCLGPVLFTPYARDLARRLSDLTGGRLLETAAGTGRVTRELRAQLPAAVTLVATDLNQAMIDFAASQPHAPGVEWRQADALALPFDSASFDAVVCQFGVMFFPDKPAGYREARRVLKPGGRFLFNVWGALDANDPAHATVEAARELFPDDPPLFLARTPHGYHDTAAIERDLRSAGFATVSVETVDLPSPSVPARDIATGFCQGTPMRGEIEERRPGQLDKLTDAVTAGIARRLGEPIRGTLSAHVITATA